MTPWLSLVIVIGTLLVLALVTSGPSDPPGQMIAEAADQQLEMRRDNLRSSTFKPFQGTIRRTGYARLLIGLIVGLGSGRTAVAAVPAELAGTTRRWVRFASPTEDLSVSEPERYTLS